MPQPPVDGLHEVHVVVGAGHPDRRHVEMAGRLVRLAPGDLQDRVAVDLAERVHGRPGGHLRVRHFDQHTCAEQRDQNQGGGEHRRGAAWHGTTVREASVCAPPGPVRTGPGRGREGCAGESRRAVPWCGLATAYVRRGVRRSISARPVPNRSATSPSLHGTGHSRMSSVPSPVVRLRAAQLPHIAAPIAAKSGINNQASAAMTTSLHHEQPQLTDQQINHLQSQRSRQGCGYANRGRFPPDRFALSRRRPTPPCRPKSAGASRSEPRA